MRIHPINPNVFNDEDFFPVDNLIKYAEILEAIQNRAEV